MRFGERLRAARAARGLSLSDTAGLIGVTEGTLYKYESGMLRNPKYEFIVSIADILEVPLAELMGWDLEDPDEDVAILRRGARGGMPLSSRAMRLAREMMRESGFRT